MRRALGSLCLLLLGCSENASATADPDAGDGDATTPIDGAWPDGGVDGDGDAASSPEPGNALLRADGSVVVLYRVTDPGASTRAVGFVHGATSLEAIDENGGSLWSAEVGAGSLFGGFDFDADGWPDAGLARSQASGQICGTSEMLDTWLDVVSGKTGEVVALTTPLASLCWTFPAATYPTTQWSGLGALFGAGGSELALLPYYATSGSFVDLASGTPQTLGTFQYPSTSAYDSSYVSDQPNAWGQGISHLPNSHVANGLLTTVAGTRRAVFFTSGRVVEYLVGPQSATQLLRDTPYLTGNRTDLAGRNYGLVMLDPAEPSRLVLIAGTSTASLHADMASASMTSDPWGQIERHVTRYDLATGALEDRFFSYAHDNNDGNQYEGRVAYPATPFVPDTERLAFNVYAGGHWELHVTKPGTLADALVLKDLFLWEIADLDRDGVAEWVLSPSRDPGEPDVPGYYYVKWRTVLARWNETSLALDTLVTHEGVIPYLLGAFREPTRTSSWGTLYPALVARLPDGLALLGRDASGAAVPLSL